jgi:hypothetical protein
MMDSKSLAMVIRFSKDMTDAKTTEFLELIHDPEFIAADVPKTQHVLNKAKTYALPVLAMRTWKLTEELHGSKSTKKKKRALARQKKAAAALAASPQPAPSVATNEPKVFHFNCAVRLLARRSASRRVCATLSASTSSTLSPTSTSAIRRAAIHGSASFR